MGLLKARKNKQFDYTPRYYKGEGSPFKLEHKFDDYRKATIDNRGLKNKVNTALDDLKNNPDRKANRIVLYIVLLLVFAFLYIIDFDLSIFLQ